MSMQCKKCKSTNTGVFKAKDLATKTGDNRFNNDSMGAITVDPALLVELAKLLVVLVTSVFSFFKSKQKNERMVLLCKDCGYWEKL